MHIHPSKFLKVSKIARREPRTRFIFEVNRARTPPPPKRKHPGRVRPRNLQYFPKFRSNPCPKKFIGGFASHLKQKKKRLYRTVYLFVVVNRVLSHMSSRKNIQYLVETSEKFTCPRDQKKIRMPRIQKKYGTGPISGSEPGGG